MQERHAALPRDFHAVCNQVFPERGLESLRKKVGGKHKGLCPRPEHIEESLRFALRRERCRKAPLPHLKTADIVTQSGVEIALSILALDLKAHRIRKDKEALHRGRR